MYIPPNKIDPKVYYSSGGEYFYTTSKINFVGYYRKDTNGYAYAGKEFTTSSPKLTKIIQDNQFNPNINQASGVSNTYNNVLNKTNQISTTSPLPIPDSLPPTSDEYSLGFYTRYFLEYLLSSQQIIVEVSKSTYYNYMNSISQPYFKNCELLWKISGPLYDIKENGILMKGGVIDSNLRSIQQAQKQMPGIEKQLVDLTLYYKS